MLIVGAKGFAKEILEILYKNNETSNLVFYDDVNTKDKKLFNEFPILNSMDEARHYFKTIDQKFSIAVGGSKIRNDLYKKFINIGGTYTSTISDRSDIGSHDVNIGIGCNILSGVKISNSVQIETGCIVYYNCIITHDVKIGAFVEISPAAILLGRCSIGRFTHIGAGSIILPDITIGENVMVAAGAVVSKNVPDNVMVAGTPAIVKKRIP